MFKAIIATLNTFDQLFFLFILARAGEYGPKSTTASELRTRYSQKGAQSSGNAGLVSFN